MPKWEEDLRGLEKTSLYREDGITLESMVEAAQTQLAGCEYESDLVYFGGVVLRDNGGKIVCRSSK